MGNLCNSTSKPLSQRDEVKSTEVRSTNPINNPKQSAKKTSVSSSAMVVRNGSGDGTEMILGAETTEPAEYDDRTSLDPAKGPGVMLLAHQHTLFCERKVIVSICHISTRYNLFLLATSMHSCRKISRIRNIEGM